MEIKIHPSTGLQCRDDGAVLVANRNHASGQHWTFGFMQSNGYLTVGYKRKLYLVHRLICEAYHGPAPEGKPFVDHIDRCKTNNTPSNLRWVSHKENVHNADRIDRGIAHQSDPEWIQQHKEMKHAADKRYREKYPDKKKAADKAYREQNYEKVAAKEAEYREAHREEQRARSKSWYYRNRERVLERMRAKYESDPEHRAKVLQANKQAKIARKGA